VPGRRGGAIKGVSAAAADDEPAGVRGDVPEGVDANTATGRFVVERDRYVDR